MAILKANAYGHGLPEIARYLDQHKLPYFGVANVHEASLLQTTGVQTPLYLLGPTFPDEREEVVVRGWTACLSTLEEIRHFASLAQKHQKPVLAHLALDTGMGRGGFLPEQLSDALNLLANTPEIQLAGLGSHLPAADEDPEFTRKQFNQFDQLAQSLQTHKLHTNKLFFHLSNSAGLLDYHSDTTNLVRPGLMLYGISPIADWQSSLQPVMTLKSRVSLIRTLPKGHGISYGRSRILAKETPVATIGLGYGDGIPRNLNQEKAHVVIQGQKLPLLGRVTMDQIMVDVSSLPSCQPGDEVEVFGSNILASELATWANTIAWEVFTSITPRVDRIISP